MQSALDEKGIATVTRMTQLRGSLGATADALKELPPRGQKAWTRQRKAVGSVDTTAAFSEMGRVLAQWAEFDRTLAEKVPSLLGFVARATGIGNANDPMSAAKEVLLRSRRGPLAGITETCERIERLRHLPDTHPTPT